MIEMVSNETVGEGTVLFILKSSRQKEENPGGFFFCLCFWGSRLLRGLWLWNMEQQGELVACIGTMGAWRLT